MLEMALQDVATALGLTYQQIQKYEKGANSISVRNLQKVSHVLRAPVVFFFEGFPTQAGEFEPSESGQQAGPSISAADLLTTSERWALLRAFARIQDPKARHRIVRLVEEIARAEDPEKSPAEAGPGSL